MRFHRALVKRKYRLLYSPKRRGRSGPNGPSRELVDAVVEIKRRNPRFGCPRLARKILLWYERHKTDRAVLYEWLSSAYKDTPHTRLLEFMKDHADIEFLRGFSQAELAKTYADRTVCSIITRQRPAVP